jgi:hypothetical protein
MTTAATVAIAVIAAIARPSDRDPHRHSIDRVTHGTFFPPP